MKKILILLLLLCSCTSITNKPIQFTSNSESVATKATFGPDYENYQIIPGEEGDVIRITDNNTFSDYSVYNITQVNKRSVGKLKNIDGNPLYWEENNSDLYDFGGSYPAISNFESGHFTAESGFMMFAHASVPYGEKKINLEFYPAFTTFRFSLISDVKNVTLNEFEISSNDYLTGTFTGTVDGIINKTSEILIQDGNRSETIQSNFELSQTVGKEFLFICLPHTIDGLKVTCKFNGIEKSLNLNYKFEPSKQYRFYLKLNTDKELTFSDGLIEIIRCCSRIKYGNNEIRNMSHDQVKLALLNSEELQLAFLDFVENTTVLYSERTLDGNISASDFKAFKNLTKIEYIDVGNDAEIELIGLDLDFACFNHGGKYIIKDCQNINHVNITNLNNNNASIEIDNCNNIESITTDFIGGTGINTEFKITNMEKLKTFSVHNGKSIEFINCPVLESISMDQASRLESIILQNLPKFKYGNFNSVDKNVNTTIINCGNDIINGQISMKGNGNAIKVNKENSDNITLTFRDNGNNIKTSF